MFPHNAERIFLFMQFIAVICADTEPLNAFSPCFFN